MDPFLLEVLIAAGWFGFLWGTATAGGGTRCALPAWTPRALCSGQWPPRSR